MKNILHVREYTFLLTVFFVSVIPFVLQGSAQYTYIFALLSLLVCFLDRKNHRKANSNSIKFIIATAFFIVFLILAKSINDYSSSRIRTYTYSLLIVSFIGSISLKREHFYTILLFATISSLSYILYMTKFEALARELWVIRASTVSAITVSIVSISMYVLVQSHNTFTVKVILIGIISTGILSALLSETRSGWVSLIITTSFTLFIAKNSIIPYIKENGKKFLIAFFTLVIFIYPIISDRIDQTIYNISKIASGETYNSIGLRLEMWKSAFIITEGNYFLGLGSSFKQTMLEYAQANKIHPGFLKWHPNHLHNEFIDRFAKQGFFGLSIFLVYISYIIKLAKNSKESMPAVVLILSLSACGLTDRSFELIEVIPFFIILTYYYLANKKTEPQ